MAERWVRVESVSEVRPGTFKVEPCRQCRVTHVFFITRREKRATRCRTCDWCRGWEQAGACDGALCENMSAIREGRLYRLELDDHASETTDTERELELEREGTR